jgi:HTH-type transcriptional regulator/antitoxin HigA
MVSSKYLSLVRRFPLRPIRSEEELDRAVEVINGLIDRARGLTADEEDYLDVLGSLVKEYESATIPEPEVSDADMLRHLIEAKGVTQSEVSRKTGIAVSTISEILSGARAMNQAHMERLARYFHIDPAVFFGGAQRGHEARRKAQ